MPAYTCLTIRENLRLVKESEACRVHFINTSDVAGLDELCVALLTLRGWLLTLGGVRQHDLFAHCET